MELEATDLGSGSVQSLWRQNRLRLFHHLRIMN